MGGCDRRVATRAAHANDQREKQPSPPSGAIQRGRAASVDRGSEGGHRALAMERIEYSRPARDRERSRLPGSGRVARTRRRERFDIERIASSAASRAFGSAARSDATTGVSAAIAPGGQPNPRRRRVREDPRGADENGATDSLTRPSG